MSNAGQSENIGLPRIQLSKDVHTHLLHGWIQVHHLVSDSQLVNEFLHTTTPDEFITNTHTHPFNGPLSATTRVSRYQKGETNLDFTEAKRR